MDSSRIPVSKAFLLIFLFTLLVSGSGTLGWLYYRHIHELRLHNDDYLISAIVQSHKGTPLPQGYLAETLGFLKKKPINIYRYSLEEGERRLAAVPVLQKAEIKKVFPNMVWVDYHMRRPVALVDDFSNTAIDAEGVLFPFTPFYQNEDLPHVYFGLEKQEDIWGKKIGDSRFQLALEVIKHAKLCENKNLKLRKLDVADGNAVSCGKRQLVLLCTDLYGSERCLRLAVENYRQGLADYAILEEKVLQDAPKEALAVKVIDLRIPQLAFLKLED